MEQRYPTQISMEEGMGLLLSAAVPMDKEEVRLLDASGRVLACDVAAMEDIPPFDRSPLDGYAVRAADIAAAGEDSPVTLKIIGEVPAGYVAERGPQEGEAVKILTGAPIPEGADVVVRYEDTSFTEEEVNLVPGDGLREQYRACRGGCACRPDRHDPGRYPERRPDRGAGRVRL